MLALTLSARVRIVPVKPFAVLVKLPMFAISSLLLLSAAPIAALMAIGKPKGERAAPFRAGAHAKDGADRLFCFARKLCVGVQIGRAHVGPPVTNAPLVCRLLIEKKKNETHI